MFYLRDPQGPDSQGPDSQGPDSQGTDSHGTGAGDPGLPDREDLRKIVVELADDLTRDLSE
jgi:hypothetical protein